MREQACYLNSDIHQSSIIINVTTHLLMKKSFVLLITELYAAQQADIREPVSLENTGEFMKAGLLKIKVLNFWFI